MTVLRSLQCLLAGHAWGEWQHRVVKLPKPPGVVVAEARVCQRGCGAKWYRGRE